MKYYEVSGILVIKLGYAYLPSTVSKILKAVHVDLHIKHDDTLKSLCEEAGDNG